jgi:hypothetical protein
MSKSRPKTSKNNTQKQITARNIIMKIDPTLDDLIDLTTGGTDDGWADLDDDDDDDCLDDDYQPSAAIVRLQNMSKQREAATLKTKKIKKRRTPKAPRSIASKGKAKPSKKLSMLGSDSTPEFNVKACKSLWQCRTLDEVSDEHRKRNERYNAKCSKATAKRKLCDDTTVTITALLQGTATDVPLLTSHQVLALSYQTVHRAIYALTKDAPDMEFALVTFISGDGGTSSDAPFVDLYKSRDKVLKTLRKMSKDFVGVTELAMFNSHGHPDGGRHIQRHEHALIWGHGIVAKAHKVAAQRMNDFPPNITGAPQIDVREVVGTEINLARICAYLFKSPHKCMNWNPPKDGKKGHMNQSEKGDRMIRYLAMARIRSMMTIGDVMFAGGQGIKIRSDLIKLLRETCHSNVPIPNRLLHPDAIGAFWVEVAKELKQTNWKLPIIARKP